MPVKPAPALLKSISNSSATLCAIRTAIRPAIRALLAAAHNGGGEPQNPVPRAALIRRRAAPLPCKTGEPGEQPAPQQHSDRRTQRSRERQSERAPFSTSPPFAGDRFWAPLPVES